MKTIGEVSLESVRNIHMIGIGGIGMSGLARLFLHEGKEVSGSDATKTENTEKLEAEGATIFYNQIPENIQETSDVPCIDLVVYTEAMPADHPELVAAHEAGLRVMNYFEALGMVANEYYLIAVAGTHGKTTTTAMLIDIFEEASFDPTAIVGSLRTKSGSNFRSGKGKYFIVEACEYKRDFLTLEPDILVITNIEHEHVDCYKDLSSVQEAFKELAMKVLEDGAIIAQATDINIAPVLEGLNSKIIDYKAFFDPMLCLPQPGVYNQLNAAAARATAEFCDIESKYIVEALENFAGTKRRFEYKGEINGAPLYDDYAHHPTEISSVLSGAKDMYPGKKIIIVFQPHTYSRTKELFDDFVTALSKADRVLLAPIYAAREDNDSGISSRELVEKIKETNPSAENFDSFDDIVEKIKSSTTQDEVVLVLGAGDITSVSTDLVS